MRLICRIFCLACLSTPVFSALPCQAQAPARPLESIRLQGYAAPITGRWLTPEDNVSGIPLGGIGAGFVELRADGLIHDVAIQNDWLKPLAPPKGSIDATCGDKT